MRIVSTILLLLMCVVSWADTRLSVRQTLANLQFRDISKSTEQKWTPQDVDVRIKELSPYLKDPKWTPFKPLKDVLFQLSSDYTLEENEMLLTTGKKAIYYIARKTTTALDGSAPALQLGLPSMTDYPLGVEINILPQKLWLDKGGIVVLTPINIEEPMVLVGGTALEKQKLFEKFSDHFAAVAKQIINEKKIKTIHYEASGDLFYMALFTYLRHGALYKKVILATPEVANYVSSTVTEPTPKTWPDPLIQDWYKDLLVKEFAKNKKFPSAILITDSQKSFVARMSYALGKQYKLPVEYMEISQWNAKDKEAKTVRFYATKYNYLLFEK